MPVELDLASYQSSLKFSNEKGKLKIFDPVRKKYVVHQPEELVRQLIIQFLIQALDISIHSIAVEKKIILGDLQKRFDILIYNNKMEACFLIECKAPKIPITQKVVDQIGYYNISLTAPYLLVSNGLDHYFYEIDTAKKIHQEKNTIPNKETLLRYKN